jgi:hypothetical protein
MFFGMGREDHKGFRSAVFLWRIGPTQAILIDKYYPAQNAPVIRARLAMVLWKERPKPCHLILVQQAKIAHHAPPSLGVSIIQA